MSNDWRKDLNRSKRALMDIVWPIMGPILGGGELVVLEGVDAQFAKLVDQYSGIDALQVLGNTRGIRALASRVQWDNPWHSFTIRDSRRSTGAKTERAKLLDAYTAKCEVLRPSIHLQSYVNSQTNELIYSCAARTIDLVQYLSDDYKHSMWEPRWNGSDGNGFCVMWVDVLKQEGVKIAIYQQDTYQEAA